MAGGDRVFATCTGQLRAAGTPGRKLRANMGSSAMINMLLDAVGLTAAIGCAAIVVVAAGLL